jgi:hypothetical protein
MRDFGGQFPEDLFYQWGGKPTAVIVEHLNEKFGLSLHVDETVRRKESYYLEGVRDAQPILPVLEIAVGMRGIKPLAIASGGHREPVEATLKAIGVLEMFDAVVCAEDYERGKPFPDPFLEAARRLEFRPRIAWFSRTVPPESRRQRPPACTTSWCPRRNALERPFNQSKRRSDKLRQAAMTTGLCRREPAQLLDNSGTAAQAKETCSSVLKRPNEKRRLLRARWFEKPIAFKT